MKWSGWSVLFMNGRLFFQGLRALSGRWRQPATKRVMIQSRNLTNLTNLANLNGRNLTPNDLLSRIRDGIT